MKTHFIKMFNYNRFANDLILQAVIAANEPKKPLQLLAHLLTAERVWLGRCKGQPNHTHNLWPDYTAAHCDELISENHDAWVAYLKELTDTDFTKVIAYQNLKGDQLQDQLSDIFTQVINHGTHSRAQAGQQLKFEGVQSLPATDYIYYLRVLKSSN
ncbi:DinB family protein [Mucilaginibacter sp. SP1R1]|uniref:DinB family protein n=1 Tax=Mucilaginibacter sp. SP1R1 TaxID=2723091 RepID=UPI00161B4DC3|nr:DinB family protein [Mucilaginibacter sp. SP1R1]MBB6151461.1 putative damage-inducible protein DinB [Mucilaginibacter sp. SP1R1]